MRPLRRADRGWGVLDLDHARIEAATWALPTGPATAGRPRGIGRGGCRGDGETQAIDVELPLPARRLAAILRSAQPPSPAPASASPSLSSFALALSIWAVDFLIALASASVDEFGLGVLVDRDHSADPGAAPRPSSRRSRRRPASWRTCPGPPAAAPTAVAARSGGAKSPTTRPTPPPTFTPLRPRWSPVSSTCTSPSASLLTRTTPSVETVLSSTSFDEPVEILLGEIRNQVDGDENIQRFVAHALPPRRCAVCRERLRGMFVERLLVLVAQVGAISKMTCLISP